MTWELASVGDIKIINTDQIKQVLKLAIKQQDAIQRVRELGNEECECLNYTSSCEHDGIQRAIKALEGEQG